MDDEMNPAFTQLQARCRAQQHASARRLGYAIVGGLLSAPLLVFGGMWLEQRRKHACACSLPEGKPEGGSEELGTDEDADEGGSDGSNGE